MKINKNWNSSSDYKTVYGLDWMDDAEPVCIRFYDSGSVKVISDI